jgi:hypothetical protein
VKALYQPVDDSTAFHDLSLDQGTSIGSKMIGAGFNLNRAVESWFQQRYCFTHGVLLCLRLIFVQQIDFTTNKGRAALIYWLFGE